MINYIKNYKLHKYLADIIVNVQPQQRMDFDKLSTTYQKVFNLKTEQGTENFKTLVKQLYEQKDERLRLKMLMLIHFLIKKEQSYSELFLQNYKTDFGGKVETYSNVNGSCIQIDSNNSDCQQSYNSLDNYIYIQVIIPYHSYLIKLSSSFQIYQSCLNNLNRQCSSYGCNNCWRLLNILKQVSNFRISLNHLGRYYQDQTESISDFLQIICEDLIIYKTQIQKQIQFIFRSYWDLEKSQLSSLILQVEQVLKQNQNLFQIFKNKYYEDVEHAIQPNWFIVKDGSLQIIEEYYKSLCEQTNQNDDNSSVKQSITTLECSQEAISI